MGYVEYMVFKEIEGKWKSSMVFVSFFYTFILLALLIEIINDLIKSGDNLDCQRLLPIEYTISDNPLNEGQISLFVQDSSKSLSNQIISKGFICAEASDTYQQNAQVEEIVIFSSIGIFTCYLFYNLIEFDKARYLADLLAKDNDLEGSRAIRLLSFFDLIQLAMVEIAGMFLIFYSKQPTDMLLNSSATIFLAEVDGLIIQLLMTSVAKYYKLRVEMEFAGIGFAATFDNGQKEKDLEKGGGTDCLPGDNLHNVRRMTGKLSSVAPAFEDSAAKVGPSF